MATNPTYNEIDNMFHTDTQKYLSLPVGQRLKYSAQKLFTEDYPKLFKDTGTLAKDIGQGTARGLASVGTTAVNAVLPKDKKMSTDDLTAAAHDTKVGNFLFGKEGKVYGSLSDRGSEGYDDINNIAKAFGKKDNLVPENVRNSKWAAVPLGIAGSLLDVSGFGGAAEKGVTKGVVESLAKNMTENAAKQIIKREIPAIADDALLGLSKTLAKETNPQVIEQALLKAKSEIPKVVTPALKTTAPVVDTMKTTAPVFSDSTKFALKSAGNDTAQAIKNAEHWKGLRLQDAKLYTEDLNKAIARGADSKTLAQIRSNISWATKEAGKYDATLGELKGVGNVSRETAPLIDPLMSKVVKTEAPMSKVVKNEIDPITGIVKKSKPVAPTLEKLSPTLSPTKNFTEEAAKTLENARQGSGGVVAREFKTPGLEGVIDDGQKSYLKGLQTSLGLDTRNVRSFDDMKTLAAELETNPEDLLKMSRSGQITDKEVVSLNNLFKRNMDRSKELADELSQGFTTASRQEEIFKEMGVLEDEIKGGLRKLRLGNTENGRAIVANRIIANNVDNPIFWYRKAERELGRYGGEFTPEIRKTIDEILAKKNPVALGRFIGSLYKPSAVEKAMTLWKAGLLTSPTTHISNMLSNGLFAGLENVKDVVATGIDKLAAMKTGVRTKAFAPEVIGAEARGAAEGAGKAWNYLKTGEDLDQSLLKYDIPREVNFENPILDTYTKSIFRGLGASDKIAREAALKGSLLEEARVIAINEGRKGADFASRVKELFLKPTDEMAKKAIKVADYRTFQGDNAVAKAVANVRRSIEGIENPVARNVSKVLVDLTVPFVKTPSNVAKAAIDYSPIGAMAEILKSVIKPELASQQQLVEALARSMTGTSVAALGYMLASKGALNGSPADQKNDRLMNDAEGEASYSIKIGGKSYSILKLSPVGQLLTAGADLFKNNKEYGADKAKVVSKTFSDSLRGFTDQTFLKGLSSTLDFFTDPEKGDKKYFDSLASGLIPNIVKKVANVIDPVSRQGDTVLDSLIGGIPGLKGTLPARRDVFGEQLMVGGGRLSIIDPFNTKTLEKDPVIQEARAVGFQIGVPSDKVFGDVQLTAKEYDTLQKVNGKILKQVLLKTINDPEYQSLTPEEKRKEFETSVREVRDYTKEQVLPILMRQRFDIPATVPDEIVTSAVDSLYNNDQINFKQYPESKQKKVVQALAEQMALKAKEDGVGTADTTDEVPVPDDAPDPEVQDTEYPQEEVAPAEEVDPFADLNSTESDPTVEDYQNMFQN